jgi:cytochrome b
MKDRIYVWDIFVRIFHWSLVAAFITSYITSEDESMVHIYSGYFITSLLAFRLIWGFIGTRHARFSDFVTRPAQAIDYLKNIKKTQSKRYVGHNPAGGYMVIALLLSLSLTVFCGLKYYGSEGNGPLADNANIALVKYAQADSDHSKENDSHNEFNEHDDDADEGKKKGDKFWKELHELFANFTILLIILHIGGVAISGRLHGENLVKAMLTGYKDK